jgi:hypothetical protein
MTKKERRLTPGQLLVTPESQMLSLGEMIRRENVHARMPPFLSIILAICNSNLHLKTSILLRVGTVMSAVADNEQAQ